MCYFFNERTFIYKIEDKYYGLQSELLSYPQFFTD